MESEIIDPVDFPFTERELAAALELAMPAQRAASDALSHPQTVREARTDREAFHAIVASGKSAQKFVSHAKILMAGCRMRRAAVSVGRDVLLARRVASRSARARATSSNGGVGRNGPRRRADQGGSTGGARAAG